MDCNKNVNDINKIVSSIVPEALCLSISARERLGFEALRHALVQCVQGRVPISGEAILVTNARHFDALRQSADALAAARSSLESGVPSDLVAQDLRAAIHHLGTITGAVTTDEVLGRIFERFCIGK